MKKLFLLTILTTLFFSVSAQDKMTPEMLLEVGRVSAMGITKEGKHVIYRVSTPDVAENKMNSKTYIIAIKGGKAKEIRNVDELLVDKNLSPDGKYALRTKDVKINKVYGKDHHPELEQSNMQVYESLTYRHWDEWEDGAFSHLFLHPVIKEGIGQGKDLMPDEPYDCPQKPFGGDEDYTWRPDGKKVVYVAKKKHGTEYTVSTNTDIYSYDIASGKTTNLSEGMMGYDMSPAYSSQGSLAWLSMKRDGYEADKTDIVVYGGGGIMNLTQQWDESVSGFVWAENGRDIYFTAAKDGTRQLFKVDYPGMTRKMPVVEQITEGKFDVTSIVGQSGNTMVVSRRDMNHATELYTVNLNNGKMKELTCVNEDLYKKIKESKTEKRYVTTTDGKQMLTWVIYPPDFDPKKKYPTILYCQGGPQSALSQFYSFRWNFQLMAANGYIIVAPNRRGMPGFGVEWNEQISKDYGGQNIQDYFSAIDELAKEPFVDENRLGCIGASYGGYSVFYLAGNHDKRFKTFIAHDGLFNLKSMYGTTEELWFVNWDLGGPYWEKEGQKTYTQFDPSNHVAKWDTPIMIIQGGKDYRVPIGQGLEAFQAAQLKGLKSRLLYFPEENHWVLGVQNSLIWHREFYKWLGETL